MPRGPPTAPRARTGRARAPRSGESSSVLVRLTKLSDQRHALEIERGGGSERVELETRSTLHHDLTHLALEELAGLDGGFFGSLAAGKTLAELAGRGEGAPAYTGLMLEIERAVVVLQHLPKVDEDPARLHARIAESLAIQGASAPRWFTLELVRAVRERLRALVGRWKATPYGGAMELSWRGSSEHAQPK